MAEWSILAVAAAAAAAADFNAGCTFISKRRLQTTNRSWHKVIIEILIIHTPPRYFCALLFLDID